MSRGSNSTYSLRLDVCKAEGLGLPLWEYKHASLIKRRFLPKTATAPR